MVVGRKSRIAPQLFALVVRINAVRQIVDAIDCGRESKLSQEVRICRCDVDAKRPNATVHRNKKEVVLVARCS